MDISIREVRQNEIEALLPILLLAEPSASALRWSLANLSDTVYRMDVDGQLAGAATVRWRDEPSELVELAIATQWQGQGLGKKFVEWLVEEGRRRNRSALVVGTSNAAIDNIAFYQKCGFRMHAVRQDYFWYYRQPRYENGIQVRDMLVFRYDLKESEG